MVAGGRFCALAKNDDRPRNPDLREKSARSSLPKSARTGHLEIVGTQILEAAFLTMNFGDELLIDFELRMPRDPDANDGWAYNWEYAECSTALPTNREEQGYATLFLTLVRR